MNLTANKKTLALSGVLLGAIAVAIALAFGLGGKEIAAQEIRKWLEGMK